MVSRPTSRPLRWPEGGPRRPRAGHGARRPGRPGAGPGRVRTSPARSGARSRLGPGGRRSPGAPAQRRAQRRRRGGAGTPPAGCRRRRRARIRGSTALRTGGAARRAAGSSAVRRRRLAATRGPRRPRPEPRSDRSGPGRRRSLRPAGGHTGLPRGAGAAQALQRGCADPGTVEAGRQLRPHPAGSGLLASHQRASTLDRGPVQTLDNQHHPPNAPVITRGATVTACPARPRLQTGLPSAT